MPFKTIVVAASGEPDDAAALRAAAQLAVKDGGHVRVIPAFPDAAADYANYGLATGDVAARSQVMERLRAAEAGAQTQIETTARDVTKSAGLVPERLVVDKRDLAPVLALAHAAVLADLAVFGVESVREHGLGGCFAETLLNARAPVLLVRGPAFAAEQIAIAWDGSLEAGRAVRAATPLLQGAKSIVAITNADDADHPAVETTALASYLALHGVTNLSFRNATGREVGKSLLEEAAACDVLVAGGYGRPRFYELVLGGTTRTLVNAPKGPHLLLAH